MFLLVEWVHEDPKSWTVVSTDQLADRTLRKSKCLIGMTVGIQWKRRIHNAKVVDSGDDKDHLERKADELAEKKLEIEANPAMVVNDVKKKRSSSSDVAISDAPPCSSRSQRPESDGRGKAKKLRQNQIQSVLDKINEDGMDQASESPVNDDREKTTENTSSESETDWKSKYVTCKTRLRDLRLKYKKLKELHRRCSQDDKCIEICEGSGVKLLQSEVSALKTMSPTITFFARNLFRCVFSSEEIEGHSLLGRKSTAVEHHVPLPSIDPCRRDAIIEFCLKTYGFDVTGVAGSKTWKKRKGAKTRIIKTLSDFVREENAKAKKAGED